MKRQGGGDHVPPGADGVDAKGPGEVHREQEQGSEVLSGKRRSSLSMIRALHEGLGIPAKVLLGKPDRTEFEKAA